MKKEEGSSNLMVILIIAVFILGIWGNAQNNHKRQLEWELELYKSRLGRYEDPNIAQGIVDSLNEEWAREQEFEERAMRSR